MSSKVEVCEECTQRCYLVHGNKKQAPPFANSFFKIMFGLQFSEFLFLPPMFAPTVLAFVDQKAVLEDSRGMQWKVTISRVDGSLAFHQGWNAFSLDHDLKVGEFLVFYYMMSLHFIVKIYDKSACEKLQFPGPRNQKKRTRDKSNSTFEDDPYNRTENSSMNIIGKVIYVSDSEEEISHTLYKGNDRGKAPVVTENASTYGMGKAPIATENASNRDTGKAPIVTENAANCDTGNATVVTENVSKCDTGEAPVVTENVSKCGMGKAPIVTENASKCGMGKAPIVTENASNCDNSYERPKLTPKEEYIEEMICLIDRELGDEQEDERTCIFDLSKFEFLKKNYGPCKSNEVVAVDETSPHHDNSPVAKKVVSAAFPVDETYSYHDDLSLRLGSEVALVDKVSVAEEAMATVFPSDASNRTEKNNFSEAKVKQESLSHVNPCANMTSGHLLQTAAVNHEENGESASNISNRAIKEFLTAVGSDKSHKTMAVSGKQHDLIDDNCQGANQEFTGISEPFDKITKAIKKSLWTWLPVTNRLRQTASCSEKTFPQVDEVASPLADDAHELQKKA